jgi:sterol desaturase/sphingolipid hydroxylase (fatty acid hydroxylase superfamily)
MTAPMLEALAGLIAIALGLGLTTAVCEAIWMQRQGRWNRENLREMAMSLSLLPPNAIVSAASVGVWGALYVAAHERALMPLPVNAATALVALIAVDFSYYWEHRMAHRMPLLWRLYHAAHHSSPNYTVATAYRVSFFNQSFAPAFYLPWVLLGFHPLLIVAMQLFAFHWQAWLHTEWIGRMGVLDRWFNTPAAHRVHHSTADEHRDCNLGAITLVWDRCFRTFAPAVDRVQYGIAGDDPPQTPLAIYTQPWRR